MPFAPPPGVRIERAPHGQHIETMLVAGAIQAYMVPRMPRPFVQGAPQVARLFQDPRAAEPAYYQRNGFYPIMHVLAVKPEVLDAHPAAAMRLFDTFERAREMAFHYYDDPNWSHLAWAAHLLRLRDRPGALTRGQRPGPQPQEPGALHPVRTRPGAD